MLTDSQESCCREFCPVFSCAVDWLARKLPQHREANDLDKNETHHGWTWKWAMAQIEYEENYRIMSRVGCQLLSYPRVSE